MNFVNNFFFIRFVFLLFFFVIFNIWEMDLNSEEIYVAFSFGLLVVLIFLSTRAVFITFFLNMFNLTYNKFLNVFLSSLFTYELMLNSLELISKELERLKFVIGIKISWLGLRILIIKKLNKSLNFFKFFCKSFFVININIFILNEINLKKFFNFKTNISKFFSISLVKSYGS